MVYSYCLHVLFYLSIVKIDFSYIFTFKHWWENYGHTNVAIVYWQFTIKIHTTRSFLFFIIFMVKVLHSILYAGSLGYDDQGSGLIFIVSQETWSR